MQPTSIFFGWNTNIPELYLQIHLTSYSHWLQRSILYEQFTVSSPDEVNILACYQARHVSFYVRSSGLWVREFVGVWNPYQGGRGFIGWTDAPQPKRTLFTLWIGGLKNESWRWIRNQRLIRMGFTDIDHHSEEITGTWSNVKFL